MTRKSDARKPRYTYYKARNSYAILDNARGPYPPLVATELTKAEAISLCAKWNAREEVAGMERINRLDAPIGALVEVPWTDVTTWLLSGWTLHESRAGSAILRKVR